jgi:AraC-like DNA-binding protein
MKACRQPEPLMASIPLPFVVSLLLALLLVGILRADEDTPPNYPFLALLVACALQSALIGLRWGYGIDAVRSVLPIVAAAIPPLVYASFASLAQPERPDASSWLHAAPVVIVALLVLLWRKPIDIVLIAISLGYAFGLLRVAAKGSDALVAARFDSASPAHLALIAAAGVLIVSALVDLLVLLDIAWTEGRYTGPIVGLANLANLVVLAFAARVAARARPAKDSSEPAPTVTIADDGEAVAMLDRIDDLLLRQGLFRDANLSLNRLARRAGLTARRISVAVNRVHGKNVSQYINGYRIDEARRLLESTDDPVTRIMFDSGFQTKSNFNREFRRITGMSPMAFRAAAATSRAKSRAK